MVTVLTHGFVFLVGLGLGVWGGYKWGSRVIATVTVAEAAVSGAAKKG